jgi:cytochrome oxidase Cu insertion factor (SCO1/SenC/PrrC family)
MKWIIAVSVASFVIVGVLAGALAVAVGGDSQSQAVVTVDGEGAYRGSEPPGTNRLPDFSLRNYDGRVVRAADLKGKVALITFLDSQCTEACPILASQIGQGIDRLSARERRHVVAVAISTDPGEDNPASVRAFLRKQGALGKLLYLAGPQAEMRALWKRFKILSSLESGEDTLHSAPLRIYDRGLVWVATLHAGVDLTPENLVHDIRVALKDQR